MSGELKNRYSVADTLDDFAALMYIIDTQIKNNVNTVELVRVLSNNNDGTLNVIPIVKDVSAENEPIEESAVYNVRYWQLQFGLNTIKAEPMVGDIGLLLVCKKDIANAEGGIVASGRKFNLCDGIYLGGVKGLNQQPTQFIEMKENELNITGTGTINITAPTVNIKDATAITLGTNATKKIALDGDPVKAGNTVVGNVVASSTIVKAL